MSRKKGVEKRGQFSRLLSGFTLVSAIITAAIISSCSRGADSVSIPNYQRPNVNCENMDVSSPKLDAPTLRAITHCLNSNHAMDALDQLLAELSDDDLNPIADALSKYVLTQAPTLYQLDQSYQQMGTAGKLDTAFNNIGTLLANDDFVNSLITLMQEIVYEPSSFPLSLVKSPKVDPQFLAALRYLAPKMTVPNALEGIDAGMTVATAPAFASLQTRFRSASSQGRTLQTLTDALVAYVQDSNSSAIEVGKRTLQELVRGDLFQALDESIGGSTQPNIQVGTDRLASVLKVELGSNGSIFDGISSLLSVAHVPIQCMKGAQDVPDADMFMLNELSLQSSSNAANYLERTHPLTILSVSPLCDYPSGISTYYPSLLQLAQTNAMEPAADFLKAVYRPTLTSGSSTQQTHPLADLFVDTMAESSLKKIIPFLSEMNDRGTWDDILLLLALPKSADRPEIESAVQTLLNPIPGLADNTSVYDVFHRVLARVSPLDFYQFISSLEKFTDSDVPVLNPLLQSMRDFYFINDVHPVVTALQSVLQDAPNNSALVASLFKVAQAKSFKESILLASKMAKDGRLKAVLSTLFTFYHSFSIHGQAPIHLVRQPKFSPKSSHNLNDSDLKLYAVVNQPMNASDPCSHLDLTFNLGKLTNPNYETQLNTAASCLSENLGDPSVSATVQFLESQKTEGGEDYFQFPISMLEKWGPSEKELQYLSDSFLKNFDSGYVFNLMDVVPFFTLRNISPDAQTAAGQVLRPLFDLAAPLIAQRESVDYLENFAASELRRDDFPQTLAVGDRLINETLDPVSPPLVDNFDRERIARWVHNKECETTVPGATDASGHEDPEIRTNQIIDDFNNAMDNWSLQNGQPKRTWDIQGIKDGLKDTFKKLADPSLNDPSESLQQALEKVLQDFNLQPGQAPNGNQHFTPDNFIKWLKDRSSDYRLISFFYQDENGKFEEKPRVKLVNSLDRMELVVLSANFDVSLLGLTVVGNSALKYLGEIAEAWGDDPREVWPDRIKALYPPGKKIKKIQDVVDEMNKAQVDYANIVGFPTLPECEQISNPNDSQQVREYETNWPQNGSGIHLPEWGMVRDVDRRLFNMNQVLSVMQENVPYDSNGQGNPHIDPAQAGGMRIYRDVFYEMYFSTQPEYRSDKLKDSEAWRNNISIGGVVTNMGLLRVLGQKVRSFPGNDKQLHDAISALMSAGSLSQTDDVMNSLFVADPEQKLIWSVIQSIFGVYNSAEGIFTPEQQSKLDAMNEQDALAQKQRWIADAGRMKQLGFYTLADGNALNLSPALVSGLANALKNFPDYLSSHSDLIEKGLRSAMASYAVRGLYEEPDAQNQERVARVIRTALSDPKVLQSALGIMQAVDQDPSAKAAWDTFRQRDDSLFGLAEFQPYRQYFDRFKDDLLSFFSDQTSDPNGVAAADHFRSFMSDRLQQGDIDQLLLLAKADPNGSYQVLTESAQYIQNGQLKNFLNLIRRSLSAPTR